MEVEVDPATGLYRVDCTCGSRTTSAARSTRCLVLGQIEGSVYMGLGEATMEEQAFRRLPPRLLECAGPQDAVAARVQEPDLPRDAAGHQLHH